MSQQPKQQRIRKSLVALTGTDERKGYFYCLKMLGILPPPPKSGFDEWKFFTAPVIYRYKADQKKKLSYYTPKCLHDVLIASHASSCEHHSFYFAHYHRHMMVLTDLFLNFAHQVLRGGEKKLRDIYPSPKFDFLYNQGNKHHWDTVFQTYKNFKGIPKDIANHYWNPTNYKEDDDLRILEELSPKESSDDPIDVLFHNINKCYPWEIHVPRRWYEDQKDFDYKDLETVIVSQSGRKSYPFFYKDDVTYTSNEEKYANGNLDPRTNADVYGLDNSFLNGWNTSNPLKVLNRNYKKYQMDPSKKNYPINSIPDNELLSSYGALSQKTNYISKQQKEDLGLDRAYCFNYNGWVPHYQLARAFFDPSVNDIKTFFEDYKVGYQRSHDYMHDLQRVILNDDFFSVTTLMFWPYHSWVDAELEIYLRRANANIQNKPVSAFSKMQNMLNNKISSFPDSLKPTLFGIRQDVMNHPSYAQNQLKWNISGSELDPTVVGAYPIVEHISPQVKQAGGETFRILSASFCARDYIITEQQLRTSNDLNDIYHDYYLKLFKNRFYFFDNIQKYDFNYNFQIGSDPQDAKNKNYLDVNGENLPKYLIEMKKQWEGVEATRAIALRLAFQAYKDFKSQKKPESKTQSASLEQQFSEQKFLQAKNIFKRGLLLLATYPASTNNGHNLVFLKINKVAESLELRPDEKKNLKRYEQEGLLVHDIFIFGKGAGSFACPKCKADKAYFVDLDSAVQDRVPRLWQNIHLQSLNKVLYDSNTPNKEVNCIYNTISLVQDPNFLDYRLVRGAEQLQIEVIGNVKSPGSRFVRVQAESYSVHGDKLKTVLSRKHYQFNKQIDFPKIFDVNNNNENNFFDRYVYKTLKGWVNVGQKKIEFTVSIPSFQRLLRLQLEVSDDNGELRVVLSDPDYEAKRIYYENNEEK